MKRRCFYGVCTSTHDHWNLSSVAEAPRVLPHIDRKELKDDDQICNKWGKSSGPTDIPVGRLRAPQNTYSVQENV